MQRGLEMDALAGPARRGRQDVLGAGCRGGRGRQRGACVTRWGRGGRTRSPPHRRRRYLGAPSLQRDALGARGKKTRRSRGSESGEAIERSAGWAEIMTGRRRKAKKVVGIKRPQRAGFGGQRKEIRCRRMKNAPNGVVVQDRGLDESMLCDGGRWRRRAGW